MKTKAKSNKYYSDVINEAVKNPTEEKLKEALKACDTLLKRYRKMQEWGFRFCGDTANIVYLEDLRECLRKESV